MSSTRCGISTFIGSLFIPFGEHPFYYEFGERNPENIQQTPLLLAAHKHKLEKLVAKSRPHFHECCLDTKFCLNEVKVDGKPPLRPAKCRHMWLYEGLEASLSDAPSDVPCDKDLTPLDVAKFIHACMLEDYEKHLACVAVITRFAKNPSGHLRETSRVITVARRNRLVDPQGYLCRTPAQIYKIILATSYRIQEAYRRFHHLLSLCEDGDDREFWATEYAPGRVAYFRGEDQDSAVSVEPGEIGLENVFDY